MKITFFLLGKKGLHTLQKFIRAFPTSFINFVCIGKDPNVENDYSSEIQSICSSHNICVFLRKDLENNISVNNSSFSFAIGWRWIIQNPHKLIVLHDSLLPKYRGFCPLVNMLINGEREIGVTALKASKEYDKGDIIHQKKIVIDYPIKIQEAIDQISNLYAEIVIDICTVLSSQKTLNSTSQNHSEATYSLWRDEFDYLIDWSESSERIKRFVDAVGYPYSGAVTFVGFRKIKVDDVSVVDDVQIESRSSHIGKIIFVQETKPIIICGRGLIRIDKASYCDSNLPVDSSLPFRSRFTLNVPMKA